MSNREEISQIRAELERVQRRVARLAQRLDEVELREGGHLHVPVSPVKVKVPTTATTLPPPLPAVGPTDWTPPAVTERGLPATPPVLAKMTAPKVPPAPMSQVLPKPPAPPTIKKPRRFGPPEGMGWETALTTYWFPRLGVILLAVGTVWGFTLISERFHSAAWMPYARVALGYGLAGVLGGIGWWLEKKYAGYARVLMGGGFGLLYFVTFATWYIPQTRIAPSQEFTLLLLALLVAAWGAAAQWRKSQLIALSMTLLGHFTVALSTLSLASPSRTAVGGLLVLGIGSAFFLIRNGWYAVAMSAMIGSYLNQFFWLAKSSPSGAPLDFALGMAVLATYLVLYALADRFTPYEHASTRTRTRNIYCGLNTGGFLILGLVLMQGFEFTQGREYLLYFATALFAGGMGWSYVLQQEPAGEHRPDSLANIYFTKASMLATAGLAAWLDGPSVTLSIALQALALLAAARRSQRPVGRILALGTALVAFAHGSYILSQGGLPVLEDPGFAGYALASLLTASVFWAIAELYRATPWHTFPQGPWRGPELIRELCESLEMLEHKEGAPIQSSRMTFSHILIAFGALLIAGNLHGLLPLFHAAPALCLLGLIATGLGLAQRSAPVLAGCTFFLILGFAWWLGQIFGGEPREPHTLWIALACVIPFLTVSELSRTLLPARFAPFELNADIQGAWKRNHALIALIAAAGAALIVATGLHERAGTPAALLTAGAIALIATGYAAATGAANLGFLGVLTILFTTLLAPQLSRGGANSAMTLGGVQLALLAATATESRWWGTPRHGLAFHRLLPSPYVLYGAAAWNAIWLGVALFPSFIVPAFLALVAATAGIGVLVLHARAMASLAAALMAVALVAWLNDGSFTGIREWHVSALLIAALSIAGDRFLNTRNPFARPWPARVLLCCAWVACLAWNGEMLHYGWHYSGLALIAAVFLAYAAIFRTRIAGALALLAGVFATLPLIVDPVPGMTLPALWSAYASLIAFWLAAERGVSFVLERVKVDLVPSYATPITVALAGTPTLLGVLCLTRVDTIQNFYLTMAWTAWGLVIFCWAMVTRQPWFRYMGLAVFALALARAFFVDVWRLEGLYRVGAMLFLGAALLSVAYGYTRWRASQEEAKKMEATPEEENL